jgi:hypothetical protein
MKFRELWSVRQTFQWFRDHDVELPANPIQGTQLVWKIPSQSLVRDVLCNPFYAGAYVWGRRPVTTLLIEGRLEKRQSAMRSAEECRVFTPARLIATLRCAAPARGGGFADERRVGDGGVNPRARCNGRQTHGGSRRLIRFARLELKFQEYRAHVPHSAWPPTLGVVIDERANPWPRRSPRAFQ